ncbi:unnamed protein product [Calypogeia fissa]
MAPAQSKLERKGKGIARGVEKYFYCSTPFHFAANVKAPTASRPLSNVSSPHVSTGPTRTKALSPTVVLSVDSVQGSQGSPTVIFSGAPTASRSTTAILSVDSI